jgi:hypothetical protein
MLTGFRNGGLLSVEDACCFPIQLRERGISLAAAVGGVGEA